MNLQSQSVQQSDLGIGFENANIQIAGQFILNGHLSLGSDTFQGSNRDGEAFEDWIKAMDLQSISVKPEGSRANVMVDLTFQRGEYMIGYEFPFGTSLAIRYVGHQNQRVMLYNVTRSNQQFDQHVLLELDPTYEPMIVGIPKAVDFLSSHDVLCGLGGFTSAFSFLSMSCVSATDWNCLASASYQLNHGGPFLLADIDHDETIYRMHQAQTAAGCQLILGFPPFERTVDDCRAQLVLFGNAISPIQGLWVYAHLLQHCGLSPSGMTPRDLLVKYMNMLLDQRNMVWPSPTAGVASLNLCFQGTTTEVTFNTTQTVSDLVRAEELMHSAARVMLSCEGVILPPWAFLQERNYHMDLVQDVEKAGGFLVPVVLEYLGARTFHLVPDSMVSSVFVRWAGILDFVSLVDESGAKIDSSSHLRPWQTVTVQVSPEDLDFELSLRLSGFGLGQPSGISGGLCLSESFCGTGLWHLDQLVRSDLLLSWTGTQFASLTCWLPSFSAAVVEFWPSTMEAHLLEWLAFDHAVVFAITWESWGWNLVQFGFDAVTLKSLSLSWNMKPHVWHPILRTVSSVQPNDHIIRSITCRFEVKGPTKALLNLCLKLWTLPWVFRQW